MDLSFRFQFADPRLLLGRALTLKGGGKGGTVELQAQAHRSDLSLKRTVILMVCHLQYLTALVAESQEHHRNKHIICYLKMVWPIMRTLEGKFRNFLFPFQSLALLCDLRPIH